MTRSNLGKRNPGVTLVDWVEMSEREPTPTASMRTIQDLEQARTAGNRPLRRPYGESFPTPTRSDGATHDNDRPRFQSLAAHVHRKTALGPLNPTWVEWLQGWPGTWSALKPLETARFLSWLRWHSAALRRLLA
jgi:hypothetical protein